jgi:uncharacterized protein YhbP (UPF0306 family)
MELERFLREYPYLWDEAVMTLATSNAAGEPHAAAVYFAAYWQRQSPLVNELPIYFFSEPESRHSKDLGHNPGAAAEIHPAARHWREIHGLQLHGEVMRLAQGPDWEAGWDLYAAKFPFVKSMRLVVARNAMYRFQTSWLRLVDNRRGFGFKAEWSLG